MQRISNTQEGGDATLQQVLCGDYVETAIRRALSRKLQQLTSDATLLSHVFLVPSKTTLACQVCL